MRLWLGKASSAATLAAAMLVTGEVAFSATLEQPQWAPPARAAEALDWHAYRSFSSADGLPQNTIYSLLQARDGLLYAGTGDGLARYDGRRWEAIELADDAPPHAVGALHQDAAGRLWIGTDSVGLWQLQDGQATRIVEVAAVSITSLAEAPPGQIWIGTRSGLWRCRAGRCAQWQDLGDIGVRSLLAEPHAAGWQLWLGTDGQGLRRLDGIEQDAPRLADLHIDRSAGLPNNIVLSLGRFAGDLWIGAGRGLARFDGQRLQVYSAQSGFPEAMVFALLPLEAPDGEVHLLAALRPGGLAEIAADGSWRLIDNRLGLPAHAVQSLLQERLRGALWIGSHDAGVARREREQWAVFDERIGLPSRLVQSVGWIEASDELWLGTAAGAVHWVDGGFHALLPAPHADLVVSGIADAPDGSRWIAHARGLQRWRGAELLAEFNADNSVVSGVAVHAVAVRRRSRDRFEVFAGTGHGLVRWREAEGLALVPPPPGIHPQAGALRLLANVDPDQPDRDRLWALRDGNLAELRGDTWRQLQPDCLEAGSAVALAVDHGPAGQRLWLATRAGLRELDDHGGCQAWPAADALGALTQIQVGSGDALYVFGARGGLRLDMNAPPDQVGRHYGSEAGLPRAEVVSSSVDRRGRVFAATSAGLAALQSGAAPPARPAPLRLMEARFGEHNAALTPAAVLSPQHSSVRFVYSLLAFEREHAHRYRFELEGLAERPSVWQATGETRFERLPPGTYRLHVVARDADGRLTESETFAFRVAPFWWQRSWVLFGAALLLLGSGLGLGRWRMAAVARRAQQLQQEVAARTRELAEANVQLQQAALTDPLTGLRNRRFFAQVAESEAGLARRGDASQALLIVLLDVDHFKRINDRFGHDAGDAVLIDVARRLERVARAGDILLRWGGEEFLLLLREVERVAAADLLRRLLLGLSATPVIHAGTPIALTASLGAVLFPADRGNPNSERLDAAITRADVLLYQAKHEGRHRAVLAADAGSVPITVLPDADLQ